MFRQMRRNKQQVSREECRRVLKEGKRAVLAVQGDEGYPYALPIDYWFDEAEDTIYFHTALEGHKVDALRRCDKVCFTLCDQGYKKEGDWAWYVTSVICFGRATPVTDPEKALEKALAFGRKYYPTEEALQAVIDRSYARMQVMAIHIEHMTGKLVHEK